MFGWIRRILKGNSEMRRQTIWIYGLWFHYGMDDDRTQRALIGLFELIPEKVKFQIIRDIRNSNRA